MAIKPKNTLAPILNFGPKIDPEAPAWLSQHLTLIYQKLNNHTQAFGLMAQKTATAAASTSSAGSSTSTLTNAQTSQINSQISNALSTIPVLGSVNNQAGAPTYSTKQGDNGALLIVNSTAATAVSLPIQAPPWSIFVSNQGTGTATFTPVSGTISSAGGIGATSLAVGPADAAYIAFDGTNWWAILFAAPGSTSGVTSLNGETGALTLTSTGATVTITTPTASTINLEAAGSGVSQIIAGTNVTISPAGGTGAVTINSSGGSAGYIKGTGNITVNSSNPAGNIYFASATVTGAAVGNAVLVSPTSTTLASSIWCTYNGVVTSANTVQVSIYYPTNFPNPGVTLLNVGVDIVVFP